MCIYVDGNSSSLLKMWSYIYTVVVGENNLRNEIFYYNENVA